ncbi:hypothetical protein [Phormidium tenue]|uniref:Uncharacterized protein n=1 Tax=Phormidium tenue NIES-30 TaxID=549789 RepID=A0A1U7J9F6_9CYAN|nr:hypothetical protein [Phormidium tenue]MBD2230824.1 hypothetical protein [Phormidium tenue FACHB-1052]OKH50130.1 hypothetical protein NIES30_05360 [Phormidium tenue NIES-30]
MQAVVNPGEAKQIEQDYAHTTLASSEMAAATAQSTAEAVQAFIQMLRERLQAARQKEQDSETEAQDAQPGDAVDLPQAVAEPIEIKMGREIVYREGYVDKDPVNKLNANTLKLLQAAVDATPQAGAEATTGAKGTINIKAGDELVYRMSKGAVETNRLKPDLVNQAGTAFPEVSQEEPPPEMPQSSPTEVSSPKALSAGDPKLAGETVPPVSSAEAATEPETKETLAPGAGEESRLADKPVPDVPLASVKAATEPEQQPSASQPAPTRVAAQPLAMASPRVVSILDVMERQNQQVVEKATQKWMQQTTRVMRRSSQQLTERVVALAANIRSRQVASTAVDLLQKYGTAYSPGRGFYVAENYVVSSKGRMVTVSDREGIELMTARKTRWGLDILKNDMVASQEADFMKARQQIQIQGIDGLSPEPPMRVRQLGNLAPAGDMGITRDLTALTLAKTARKLLDVTGSRPNVQGKRVFQGGSQYRIEETPNSLKIQAGERGQILSIDNGKIKSDLTSKDVAYFRFIDRELSQDLQRHQPATVTPLNSRQRSRAVGMAMGE